VLTFDITVDAIIHTQKWTGGFFSSLNGSAWFAVVPYFCFYFITLFGLPQVKHFIDMGTFTTFSHRSGGWLACEGNQDFGKRKLNYGREMH
jgi:hypothetical protein